MARQFSRAAVEDLRHVIREALKSRTWAEVSTIFGRVSRFKLHKFISAAQPNGQTEGYVPPLVDLRAMVDGLADSLGSAADLRRDCAVQIEALLDLRPPQDPFATIRELARIDEASLRDLSRDLSGSYLCFRRHRRAGVLISHLRINDSYDRKGLILCEFRQDVHGGDVYVIKALLYGKDEFVYVVGHDERYGLMRSLTLAHVARKSRQLYGIVSGVEPTGPPFSARMLLIRVESDFESLRSETGHVEDLAAAEAITARHTGTMDLLSRCRITADDGYLSAPLDFI